MPIFIKQIWHVHKTTDSYSSWMRSVDWPGSCTQTDSIEGTSRRECCLVGLMEMLGASLPWKLWDLHSCPSSSLYEWAPELCEPRPESQEDPADGISSHCMTTCLSKSLLDPDRLEKTPRLFFLLNLFFRLNIVKSEKCPCAVKCGVFSGRCLIFWWLCVNPYLVLSQVSSIM